MEIYTLQPEGKTDERLIEVLARYLPDSPDEHGVTGFVTEDGQLVVIEDYFDEVDR